MIVLKVFAVIYVLGILLSFMYLYRRYWHRNDQAGWEMNLATQLSVVFASLVWLPFFMKAFLRMIAVKRIN